MLPAHNSARDKSGQKADDIAQERMHHDLLKKEWKLPPMQPNRIPPYKLLWQLFQVIRDGMTHLALAGLVAGLYFEIWSLYSRKSI